jgi:hypothetical protein
MFTLARTDISDSVVDRMNGAGDDSDDSGRVSAMTSAAAATRNVDI